MAAILTCHVTRKSEFPGIFIITCGRSHDHIINNQEYTHTGHYGRSHDHIISNQEYTHTGQIT